VRTWYAAPIPPKCKERVGCSPAQTARHHRRPRRRVLGHQRRHPACVLDQRRVGHLGVRHQLGSDLERCAGPRGFDAGTRAGDCRRNGLGYGDHGGGPATPVSVRSRVASGRTLASPARPFG
jgi:hypothetical protein